jgi:putative endonuclease
MPLFSRLIYGLVSLASRNGLAPAETKLPSSKAAARRTGIQGETFAYWYLRRHGYVIIARNYTAPGIKGEMDLVGYDGPVLAFIEVKTRTPGGRSPGKPEEAVTPDKRRNLSRMARLFLADRNLREAQCRFDVLAIEDRPGSPPLVRLHKGAFTERG